MATNKMDEILKHFPDLEDGWKEMEERFKKDPAEREMLSLKYREMLEREKNVPEPEFTKTKKAETTSKVASKVTSKVSDDLEEAANNAVIALVPSFGQKYSDGSYVSSCIDCFNREELLELFKAGAKWQKERIMANSTNATICLPYENKDGGYTQLIDVSRPLPIGNNIIAIIFKEK